MRVAVVTGASSGIGREFVRQLEYFYKDLDEIWVIARREERLEQLRKEVNVPLRIFAGDLQKKHVYRQFLKKMLNYCLEVNKMTTYRIEEDCLGQIKVKADKYWKSQTQRSLENFKIGQELMPKSLIHSFAILKEACAKANLHFNKISEKQCEAIVKVCQNIEDGQYLDQFPLHVWQTGSGTQTNMNANEVISMLGNEYAKENILHPNDTVNASQSSNDTFPAALHIMVAQKINEELLPQLDQMINQIKSLKKKMKASSKLVEHIFKMRHHYIFHKN